MQLATFTIVGKVDHLGELKTLDDGKVLQPITVKVTKTYDNKERVAIINVMTIGKVATVASNLGVGDPVYVSGNINSREWKQDSGDIKHVVSHWANVVAKIDLGHTAEVDDDSLPF